MDRKLLVTAVVSAAIAAGLMVLFNIALRFFL